MTTTTARIPISDLELAQQAEEAAGRINLRRYRGDQDTRRAVWELRSKATALVDRLDLLEREQRERQVAS